MLFFAVIANPFAVIGHHRDQRAIELSRLLEGGDQPRNAAVDVCDFAVVRRGTEPRFERSRRIVRRVRVVEMNPGEERLSADG